MEKMKVVLYTSRLGIGGIQTFVLQMAEALQAYPNVQVAIFCHYPEQAEEAGIPKGVELWTLSKKSFVVTLINKVRNIFQKVAPKSDVKEWLTKRYFFRKLKQQQGKVVIHNNIQVGDALVYAAQQQLGIPYITTLHGAYKHILREEVSEQEKEELRHTLTKLLDTASSIVYLSDKNLEPFKVVFEGFVLNPKKIVRIFNGLNKVQADVFNAQSHSVIFGLVARGVPYKGWEEAILATITLVKKYPDKKILLKLYGNSDYLDKLATAYQAFNDFILFCGATNSPLDVVQTFTVGLLPTYLPQEEMPFTIIEYLACRKPVIATPAGAIPEMLEVEGDIAGEIIPFGENGHADVSALEKAMEKFLLSPSYQQNKSIIAEKAFEKFDINNTAKDYYQLYKNAIKK